MAELCRIGDTDGIACGLYNVFENAVYPVCPEALAQRDALLALGARGALLSGSGSAVFGIFADAKEAEYAASQINGFSVAVQSAPTSIPIL
jgi:4-diphosphocytidyl-2-C-methyl-D-erythritol kinase